MNSDRWVHSHQFAADTSVAETRTRIVIAITATMMAVELAAGVAFNSMALLADGWHMSTHVAAFLITALAYAFSRRHATDARYSFGPGKAGVLGGFASAILLALVALLMAGESLHRVFAPLPIAFNAAIGVASAGMLVNLVCAVLLRDTHSHHAGHAGHTHAPRDLAPRDLNRHAAYIHVLADTLTSVTAIVALLAGKYFGWNWMDPVMGIAGSAVVAVWAYGLVRMTSGILLDRTPESSDLPAVIRESVERGGEARVTDLHVWQVAEGRFAAIVTIVTPTPQSAAPYRALLSVHEELVHLTLDMRHPAE